MNSCNYETGFHHETFLPNLPNELLCHIFGFINEFADACNVMLTCRRFYNIVQKNKQWEKKLSVAKKTRDQIKIMSQTFYPVGEPSVSVLDNLIHERNGICKFVEDMLSRYVFSSERTGNLTWSYYAKKVLLHLRKGILEKTITEMMKLPNTQVSLFKGALLISRWGQIETEKNMKSREVYRILEGITKRVKEIVQMNFGSAEKITDFSIVEIINHVLYNDLGFIVDECDYGPLGNFFIEKVLLFRRGHSIMMSIITHEVAIQMGIRCSLVLLNTNSFLLACKNGIDSPISYIGIEFVGVPPKPSTYSLSYLREELSDSRDDIFQRVVSNLIASSWNTCDFYNGKMAKKPICTKVHFAQLACIISPNNLLLADNYISLCHIYSHQQEDAIRRSQHLKIDHWALEGFRKYFQRLNAKILMKAVHHRHPSMKYAVGMVMQYTRNSEKIPCLCVISMWSACYISSLQYKIMYHVLFDDGTSAVVEEGDLKIYNENSILNHPDIGIYFKGFDGLRYIPNSETASRFPDDVKIVI